MSQPERPEVRIFNAALELPAPERPAWLDQACGGDPNLRREVEALLQACSGADDFFKTAIFPQPRPRATAAVPIPVTEKAGDRIGRYKLLQEIGEGGCGIVFMAEQEEPVRRRVALKVIKLGMDTRQVVARFEAERQALALMDHPNIAKVLDAGATATGRPYFVMELVRGVPLTRFCEEHHLSMRQRLDLFVLVCHAVQHAHQKGIIHRDLKPSNILATVNDGVPVPKVIDFGIAKATTGQQLTDKTLFTAFEQFMGTPAYMSPEQAVLTSLDIDTRSDIYSLGVLLYELLTGKTPFDAEELWKAGMDEMRRTIREVEPVKPSTRLTLDRSAAGSAGSGKSEIRNLRSEIDKDLDWIVMKALEKDRTRRYETASGFAADILRHLNHEAVTARPPSLLYKFQKAVRRNKPAFAAAAAVLLALLAGLGLTAWQAVRATKAEQAARRAGLAERAQSKRAGADRERAVLAESRATNALHTAQERMVKLNVAEGWRRVEEGDYFGALLPFAEGFALEQDKPDRAEIHQMRLASLLQRSPKLVNVWSVGTNINHAEFSRDGTSLLVSSTSHDFRSETQTWARVFDSVTGRPITGPMEHRHRINSVVWNDDETRILTASSDGTARVWEAETGRPLAPPLVHEGPVLRARFSPEGTNVLTFGVRRAGPASWHNDALLMWNFWNSAMVWSNQIPAYSPRYNPTLVSPDATTVVTSCELFDAANGKFLKSSYRESSATPKALALESSWKPGAESPVEEVAIGHYDQVAHAAEFSPDGSRLFINHGSDVNGYEAYATLRAGKDITRVLKRWPSQGQPTRARFSRDSLRLATANDDASVRIWDAADGSPVTSPLEHGGFVADVCFSADGAWLASGTGVLADGEGCAQVWEVASGKPLTPRLPHDGPVLRVAFSKDHTRLFVVGETGTVAEWNLAGIGVPRFTWPAPGLHGGNWAHGILLNDEGTVMATMQGNVASVWNLSDGSRFLPAFPSGEQIGVAGLKLVAGGSSGIWSIIDLQTGQRIIHDLSDQNFSGTRFAPVTNRSTASPLLQHRGEPWFSAFSVDSKFVLSAGSDLMVRYWSVPSAEPTSLPTPLPSAAWYIKPTGDGRGFITVHTDDTVRFWELPKGRRPCACEGVPHSRVEVPVRRKFTRLKRKATASWQHGVGSCLK